MKTDRIPLKHQKEYWHIISKRTHKAMGKEMAQWLKEGIVLEENLNLLLSPHVGHLKTTYNAAASSYSLCGYPHSVGTFCCKISGTLFWPPQEPHSYRHAHIHKTKNLTNLSTKFFLCILYLVHCWKKIKIYFP